MSQPLEQRVNVLLDKADDYTNQFKYFVRKNENLKIDYSELDKIIEQTFIEVDNELFSRNTAKMQNSNFERMVF